MVIKLPCRICENPVANNHHVINCNNCDLCIHIKCNTVKKQTYIYFMCENSCWYWILRTKTFHVSYSVLKNYKSKQAVIGKQVKFTDIVKQAISNGENFIKAINSESNIIKYLTIQDLNSTFNNIGNPFCLLHLNVKSLSFRFDELQSLVSKPKNDFQITGISETSLKKTREITTNIQLENSNIENVPTESAHGWV